MKFDMDRKRADSISDDVVVAELKRVAEHYGRERFSRHDFDKVAKHCKGSKVLSVFGSWDAALDAIGIELKPRKNSRKDQIPEGQLFSELERIWKLLGHRPSKMEWEASSPKFSYTTYKTRFNGWLNACALFVDHKSDGSLLSDEPDESGQIETSPTIPRESKRNIPLRTRLTVLKRDKFRCVLCGRSPANVPGVVLHLDHLVPFSKGGKTTADNLRVLCRQCNLGKGNDERY